MRGLFILVLGAMVVAACGRVPQTGPGPDGYRLYEAVSTRSGPAVDIVDSRTHTTLGVLPLGTPSADWKHYYAVRRGVLEDLNPRSGTVLHSLPLDRPYDVPSVAINGLPGGLSQNGRWLVLQTPGQAHLLVVDTSFAQRPIAVDLEGSFIFDAISNDGGRLYLIHYLSANDYQIRFYYVTAGYLDPTVVIDKFDPTEPMTGRRLATVASNDGLWQFTVYARANKGAFIHALLMDSPISLCLELPGSGWNSDRSVFRWSLALSPDGTRLFATNGALGLVVEVAASGNQAPAILRTQSIPKQPLEAALEMSSGDAVISPDGHMLAMAGATGVEWVDTGTMRPTAHALPSWTVRSLGLSADGRSLFALKDSGQIAELSPDGVVLSMFDPAVGQPMALMRVEAP
jgi:hypothetical protein